MYVKVIDGNGEVHFLPDKKIIVKVLCTNVFLRDHQRKEVYGFMV